MAKGLVPDKPPVPARPKRPVTRPGSIAKPVVAVVYAAQTAAVDDEARTVALNAASRIRHLLAKGLASRSTVSSRKENEGGPVAQSPSALLSKFRAAQSDLVERDKTVDALKDMLRRGGAPDAESRTMPRGGEEPGRPAPLSYMTVLLFLFFLSM